MTTTLIKNGKVYSHETHRFFAGNLLIVDELITGIGDIDASADEIIDATDMYVAPGFIDMHCHIFNHPLFNNSRLAADRIGINQGVTCLIDTGSAGPGMIDSFREFVIDTQETTTYALCNIGSPGIPGSGRVERLR